MRIPGLIALLGALAAGPAAAQVDGSTLRAGQRVRIVAPMTGLVEPTIGRVVRVHADTAQLHVPRLSMEMAVPLAYVSSLETSRGSRRTRNLLIGTAVGAAAGAVGAFSTVKDETRRERVRCEFDPVECPFESTLQDVTHSRTGLRAGITAGAAVVGLAAGMFLVPAETWTRVPLYAAPSGGGQGGEVALRLRF
jgi:hypothetical protein